MSDHPRLLVVAYRFPPQGRVGAHRTAKFVKYLGEFGWQPVVHTVSNPYSPFEDTSLVQQIPASVQVYRTPTIDLESLEVSFGRLRRLLRMNGSSKPSNGTRHLDTAARMRDHVWRHWLVPDPQVPWIPGAFLRSLWIARRHSVRAIYSSSPPHSVQLVALALRHRLGLPWIADLRDPWTEGLHRQPFYAANDERRLREERWEREVCRDADQVLVATEGARADLLRKYPECPSDRITCIPNGFDPEDFVHVSRSAKILENAHLHLTLLGNVESACDLKPLFQAVHELVARRPETANVLRINFVGTKRAPRYDAFIAQHRLEGVIRFLPPVEHPVGLQYLAESQVGLIAAKERFVDAGVKISSKLFEYFYLRKPVLALTTPGITTRLLERARLGVAAPPDDVQAIGALLELLLERFKSGRLRVDPDDTFIESFDRRSQAKSLARILDRVAQRDENGRDWRPVRSQ